jgi:hypothetical protein
MNQRITWKAIKPYEDILFDFFGIAGSPLTGRYHRNAYHPILQVRFQMPWHIAAFGKK